MNPAVVIFSLIPDDVRRTELSVFFGSAKPYFVVDGDNLVMKNTPPPLYEPSLKHVGVVRKIFGYSYAFHRVMLALGLQDWWLLGQYELRQEHENGAEIGCIIMRKLREMRDEKGFRLLIFLQYGSSDLDELSNHSTHKKFRKVVQCAYDQGLEVADSMDVFRPHLQDSKSRQRILDKFWRGNGDPHMSEAGDRKMAEFLAQEILR